MNEQPLVLIQENVTLEVKSDAPITSGQALKQKGQLFARPGQLVFLRTGNGGSLMSAVVKAAFFGVFALLFFAPEKLPFELSENVIQMLIYAGFGLYAFIPRLFNKKAKTLTEETIEQLAFEGAVTRIYWREVLEAVPPGRAKGKFLRFAELDLGYQKLALSLNEATFLHAVSVMEGNAGIFAEAEMAASEELDGSLESLFKAFKKKPTQ